MTTKEIIVLILAAGKGTRMKSDLAKVLHPIGGRPMIEYVLDAAETLGAARIIAVVGHQADKVEAVVGRRATCVTQEPQLGTGHAVTCAVDEFKDSQGTLVLLYGDVPLIKVETLRGLLDAHESGGHAATVLSAILDDATGYGRIIRKEDKTLERIVEEKDASDEEKAVREINTGIYCFRVADLLPALDGLDNDNAQNEYYITDVAGMLVGDGKTVGVVVAQDPEEAGGINTVDQLAGAEKSVLEEGTT